MLTIFNEELLLTEEEESVLIMRRSVAIIWLRYKLHSTLSKPVYRYIRLHEEGEIESSIGSYQNAVH